MAKIVVMRLDVNPALTQGMRIPGSEDWLSPPPPALAFGDLTGAAVHIAPGRGHMLGKDYVGPLLDGWLAA